VTTMTVHIRFWLQRMAPPRSVRATYRPCACMA
jgi:hypothetical protein